MTEEDFNPNRPEVKGNYSVNIDDDTSIEIDVKRYLVRLIKERHPDLYKEAKVTVENLYNKTEE